MLTRYALQGITEQYLGGVSRSFIYELYNQVGPGDGERYGLLNPDKSPTPRAVAVRNLIDLLEDNSWSPAARAWARSSFAGTPLDYTPSAPPTVRQLLTQKSDGYYLLLWNEVDTGTRTTSIPAPAAAAARSTRPRSL